MIDAVVRERSFAAELRFLEWLRRHALTWTAGALYACIVFVGGAQEFEQDSWLSLSGGRDIARHGLPWHDRLNWLTHGERWVDQQWLGKLFLYGLTAVGGLSLVFVIHVSFVVGAFGGAMLLARRRGASDRAVFLVAAATCAAAPWAWQLRAQSLSYVLFVAVFGLLAADYRAASRRVWLVFPVLAIWANVHGSVMLGAALTVSAGLLQLARRQRRGAFLCAGGALCIFASPYQFHLFDYYRALLFNPLLERFVAEWEPSSSPLALPFFATLVAMTWLLGRHWSSTSAFERVALALTGLAGVMAFRGIVWFVLATMVIAPALLDAEISRPRSPSRFALSCAALSTIAALTIGVFASARVPTKVNAAFPASAATVVARAVSENPRIHVFASERYADWLLWKDPRLAGRLVYDIRFELFDRKLFDQLLAFHDETGANWQRALHGARLLVLYRRTDELASNALRRERGARVLYENHDLIVILRPRSIAPPQL